MAFSLCFHSLRGYNKGMSQAKKTKAESSTAITERCSWRRLLQYRLRTLLILTTVIAALVGLLARWSYDARQQHQVVMVIEAARGRILYDFHFHGLREPPYWPRWLVNAIGVDYFAKVEYVTLMDTEITDTNLLHLNRLTALHTLDLTGLQITDALEPLTGLTKLHRLYLSHTQVTDSGLMHVKGLSGLQELELCDSQVTDKGLEHLKGLSELQTLKLCTTKVTDYGLRHLKGLTSLQHLDLAGTEITDAGLEYLEELTNLKYLSLNDTAVTDTGKARLEKALPNCKIHY
ncbi:MAG: hypothetical protein K8T91_15010 [Planctomycetes bacterium]|nr:hypothetical protein [Planctomycetota bacterium]